MLKVLDLFSGIGGFSIGLERTGGFETVAFCEIEKYPRAILAQHWPSVRIYNDVKTLTAEQLRADGIVPNAIVGGFPCQDISLAGKGAGLEGERSGLWWEFYRLIKEIKPQWVIAENVSALRSRGLDTVLWALSEIGYDAEWHCIPASSVGAPHQRDRIWIVAYPNINNQRAWDGSQQSERGATRQCFTDGGCLGIDRLVADSGISGLQRNEWLGPTREERESKRYIAKCSWWAVEPNVGRVAHGVPKRVDRLKALGNAVVPQIPELIGYAILNAMEDRNELT